MAQFPLANSARFSLWPLAVAPGGPAFAITSRYQLIADFQASVPILKQELEPAKGTEALNGGRLEDGDGAALDHEKLLREVSHDLGG